MTNKQIFRTWLSVALGVISCLLIFNAIGWEGLAGIFLFTWANNIGENGRVNEKLEALCKLLLDRIDSK